MSSESGGQRKLGLAAVTAAACGLVVASTTLVTLGQGFGLGGAGFIWAIVLAVLIHLFVTFTFGELAGIIPKAGSISHFTLPAIGRFWSMIAVIAGYVMVTIFAGSTEALVGGLVTSNVFMPGINATVISIIAVLILTFINYRGIEVYAWVQITLTAVMMATLIVLGLIGLANGGGATPIAHEGGFNPMGISVTALTSLAFWLFVGLEYVTPMAEDIKNPGRNIPLGMALALGLILVAMLVFGYGALPYTPLEVLANSETPHVAMAAGILGTTGEKWMALVSILASLSTVNTLICALPRLIQGMAHKGQAPAVFSTNNKYGAPTAGVILIALCIMVPILLAINPDSTYITTAILAAIFSWCASYVIGHINVMVMRARYPKVDRPFKSPLFPIPQVLGILALLYVMYDIHPDPEMKKAVWKMASLFLGGAAVLSAIWIGGFKKWSLFKPVPLADVLAETDELESAVGG